MIETQRLYLRTMTDEDMQDFYDIFSSDNVNKFVKKMDFERVKQYFAKRKLKEPNPYDFAVVLKENNKMIGTITLKEKTPHEGTLSYVFNDKYWNKGYASEAIDIVIKKAFGQWQFKKILADCQHNNIASTKILQKFGFVYKYSTNDKISHLTNENVKFNFYDLDNNTMENCQ